MGFYLFLLSSEYIVSSCCLKKNAKLWYDFYVFYISNIYKDFSHSLEKGFSRPWLNISVGTSLFCLCIAPIWILKSSSSISKIQMPCFSLFEIYLKSSLPPPFLIPNNYTEENKTINWYWCRRTDTVIPLIFILQSFSPFLSCDLFISSFFPFWRRCFPFWRHRLNYHISQHD